MRNLALVCLLGGWLILGACSNEDDNSDDSQSAALPPQATVALQPLLIWHSYTGAEQTALEQIGQNFETEYPSLNVEFEVFDNTNILTEYEKAVNAGRGPDLLLGPADWLMPLTMQGIIQPVSQELLDEASNNLTKPVALATQIEELPYGIVFSVEFATLYYNRTQIALPADIFDDLLIQARTHPLIIDPTFFTTSGLFFGAGGLLMGNAADNRVTKSFLELFLIDLQDLAATSGIIFSTEKSDFLEGRAGFLLTSSAEYPTLKAALGDDLGVAQLPRIPPNQWSTLISMQVVMQNLNSTAQAVDSATAFVSFLITPTSQRLWFEQTGHAPANSTELNDDLRIAWGRTLEWGKPIPLPREFNTVMYPALDQAVHAIVEGGQDPDSVAENTVELLDNALDDDN